MKVTLQVWRQTKAGDRGEFVKYEATDVSEDMSFLEMLDVVNEKLSVEGALPIAFDSDCREGICGACSMVMACAPARAAARATARADRGIVELRRVTQLFECPRDGLGGFSTDFL